MTGRNTLLLPFLISIFITIQIQAQTVFVFNKSSNTYDFQSATTWVNNAVPQDGDVLSFSGTGNNNISNVPDRRFSKIVNVGGGTITLQAKTGGSAITIDELDLTKEIAFSSTAGPNLFNVSIGTISGPNSGIRLTNNGAYVTITGVHYDKGTSFFGNWGTTRLTYGENSIYKAEASSPTVPVATWSTNSNVSITGLVSATGIGNFNQRFYNFIFDSPALALSTTATSINLTASVTCAGVFKIQNIGGRTLSMVTSYLNDFNFNDGTIALGFQANLNIAGNVTQTGGTFTYNSAKITLNGTSNQKINFTNVGTNNATIFSNTGTEDNNSVTLLNNTSFNNVTLAAGILSLNGYNLSVAGVITQTGGALYADDNSGLYLNVNNFIVPTITGTIGRLYQVTNPCSASAYTIASNTTVSGVFNLYANPGCTNATFNLNNVNLFITGNAYLGNQALIATTGTGLTIGSTGKFIYARNGGTLPTATWMDGSVCSITGITVNPYSIAVQNFYDFVWDCPAQTGAGSLFAGLSTTTVRGTLFIKSTGTTTGSVALTGSATAGLNTGNFIQTGGLLVGGVTSYAWTNTGDFAVVSPGIFSGGNNRIISLTLTGSNVNLTTTGFFNNFSSACSIYLNAPNCTDVFKMTSDWIILPQVSYALPTFYISNGVLDLNGYAFKLSGTLKRGNTCASINGGSTSSLMITNYSSTSDIPTITNGLYNFYLYGISAVYNQLDNLTVTGGFTVTGSNYNVGANRLQLPLYQKASWIHNGTGARLITTTTSNVVFPPNSLYLHDVPGGTIPTATWMTGSTASITGLISTSGSNIANQNFYNLIFDNPNQFSALSLKISNNQSLTVSGVLGIYNTNNQVLYIPTNANETQNVKINTLSITSGNLYSLHPTPNAGAFTNIEITGDVYVGPNGSFTKYSAASYATNITFTGVNSSFNVNSNATFSGFNNLLINKAQIGNSVQLGSDFSTRIPIKFVNGLISTGSYVLSATGITLASSVTGWVNGNLVKNFSVSGLNQIKSYEVGSSTAYMPVTLSTSGIATAGSVIVGISDQEHPQVLQGCINAGKSINKYWSVKSLEGTLSPFNFNAILRYTQATDLDAAANVANLNEFVYNGSSWNTAATPAFSSSAISITGLSASGDYYFAESGPTVSSISGASIVCQDAGASTYSVAGNSCSTSYSWTVAGGSLSGTGNSVSVVWTASGINHIYVTASNGSIDSDASVLEVTITGIPAAPSAIAGTAEVCEGSNQAYSVTSIPGLNYGWTVTGGSLSVNGVNASIIWTTPGVNSIAVSASNQCGTSPETLQLNTVSGNVPQTSAITGATEVCMGSTIDYSVTTISGLNYNWTITGGSVVTNGGAASITWTAPGINSVSVSASNACFTSVETIQYITVTGTVAAPSAITGSFDVCQGNDDYNITTIDGLNYSWTVTGGSFTLNGGTASITWTAPGINGISVTASNSCFTSAETMQAVTVTGTPAAPSAIAGAMEVCENSAHDSSITTIDGLNYAWTVTGGSFTVNGGTASVTWTATGINSIAVSASNACFTSDLSMASVTIGGILSAPSVILGTTEVCEGSNHDYTVNTIDGLSYSWTVTGGSFTLNNATISVLWTAPGVNSIAVTAASTCFTSVAAEQSVTVTGTPDALSSIAGSANVTVSSQNVTYSVAAVDGIDYIWTVTGGGTLVANGNTATVIWNTPGTYTVSVIPANACVQGPVSQIAVTVDQFSINISAAGNMITENNGTLQLSATANSAVSIAGFSWSVSDTSLASISSTGLVSALGNGIVTVSVFVTETPAIQAQYVITISGQEAPSTITGPATTTGIVGNLDNQVSISPNPAADSFTLNANLLSEDYSVELYNLQGVLVAQRNVNGLTSITFSTDTLSNGLYFIKVKSGTFNRTERLVISK